MFQRFTDQAHRVVALAQEEARMLTHSYIGTEHLLLGLLHEDHGVAAEALDSLGIRLETVRQQVEEIVGRGQQAPSGHIPFTARAKRAPELAAQESDALGHDFMGTGHLLLGLIRVDDGVAAQVLVTLGADQDRVRQQVIQLLHGDQALGRIDAMDRRLAAIERWVGMRPDLDDLDQEIAKVRREKEAAIDRQDFKAATGTRDQEKQLLAARAAREKEGAEPAAGRLSLARELGRVNAELARLRAIMREHGIPPGDDAA